MTSPLPASPYEIARDALALIAKARAEIARVCSNEYRMRISIPADRANDTDLIVCDALDAAEAELLRVAPIVEAAEAQEKVHDELPFAACRNDAAAATNAAVRAARSAQ